MYLKSENEGGGDDPVILFATQNINICAVLSITTKHSGQFWARAPCSTVCSAMTAFTIFVPDCFESRDRALE